MRKIIFYACLTALLVELAFVIVLAIIWFCPEERGASKNIVPVNTYSEMGINNL